VRAEARKQGRDLVGADPMDLDADGHLFDQPAELAVLRAKGLVSSWCVWAK
jgi:hypothetical protein